jgi:hypothetical protein
MKRGLSLFLCFLVYACFPSLSSGKELPKVAVWDLLLRSYFLSSEFLFSGFEMGMAGVFP